MLPSRILGVGQDRVATKSGKSDVIEKDDMKFRVREYVESLHGEERLTELGRKVLPQQERWVPSTKYPSGKEKPSIDKLIALRREWDVEQELEALDLFLENIVLESEFQRNNITLPDDVKYYMHGMIDPEDQVDE